MIMSLIGFIAGKVAIISAVLLALGLGILNFIFNLILFIIAAIVIYKIVKFFRNI